MQPTATLPSDITTPHAFAILSLMIVDLLRGRTQVLVSCFVTRVQSQRLLPHAPCNAPFEGQSITPESPSRLHQILIGQATGHVPPDSSYCGHVPNLCLYCGVLVYFVVDQFIFDKQPSSFKHKAAPASSIPVVFSSTPR